MPDSSKCRSCGVQIPNGESAYIVSFKSKMGMGFLAFAMCSLKCLIRWAEIEGKRP